MSYRNNQQWKTPEKVTYRQLTFYESFLTFFLNNAVSNLYFIIIVKFDILNSSVTLNLLCHFVRTHLTPLPAP